MYNPKDVLAIYGETLRTRAGVNIREKQGTSYPVLVEVPGGTILMGLARVVGEPANGSIEWWETKVETQGQIRTGYVSTTVVDVITNPPDDQSFLEGFEEARLKAAAAASSIKP